MSPSAPNPSPNPNPNPNPSLSSASAELIQLITSATATIEHAYKSNHQPLPHLNPSSAPDAGSDRGTDPGTLPSADFVQALQVLKGATTQLLAQLTPPALYTAELAWAHLDSAALGIAVESRVADAIHKHDPDASKGVPVHAIADETGLEVRHLARILRSLATRHVFVEVSPDVFANNRHAVPLRTGTPLSCTDALAHWVYDIMPGTLQLPTVLADREHAAAFSVAHSGAARAYGKVFWDFLQSEPGRAARFDQAMRQATSFVSIAASIAEDVPWAEDFGDRNPQGIFVDVGAGAGHQALSIAPKLPGWQFVVEDLAHTIETSAKQLWNTQGAQYKHRLVAQDFFKPQAVKGADVYYMKHIIHDWPDKESVQILQHIRDAADPARSRLLIADVVIEPALPSTAAAAAAAAASSAAISAAGSTGPLLSNLGGGAANAHRLDMIMMTALEAQERTLAEFERNVIAPAGWKLEKVHRIRSHVRLAVLECVPV
ncbi:hypothetical protein OC835_001412 [Tilletia horrida]|nr:hypothetical protein OC835_001412 [Tilletia horrida]